MKSFIGFLTELIIAFILDALLTFPEMLLWNCLMPPIFALTKITFWQMFGLNLLLSLLLSSKNVKREE